jgi:hypothetical protein
MFQKVAEMFDLFLIQRQVCQLSQDVLLRIDWAGSNCEHWSTQRPGPKSFTQLRPELVVAYISNKRIRLFERASRCEGDQLQLNLGFGLGDVLRVQEQSADKGEGPARW